MQVESRNSLVSNTTPNSGLLLLSSIKQSKRNLSYGLVGDQNIRVILYPILKKIYQNFIQQTLI